MLSTPLAFSAAPPKTYCAPLGALTAKLSSCTDNEVLMADAGVKCLKKFEKAADEQTKEIEKMLKDNANSSGNSQESLLKGSEKNYLDAKRRLEQLIADGKRAVQEVDVYSDNLAMPEDFERAKEMGFTNESFLASIPCYNNNRKVLRRVGREFFQKINDLEQTREMAFNLETKSGTAKKNVGGSSMPGSDPVSSTKGSGSVNANVKGQKTDTPSSDITGTNKKTPSLKK